MPKQAIILGVCGSLRRGASSNRFLMDEKFIGTFYIPGLIMYLKEGQEPVLVKGPGIVVMDLFEVKMNKLDLLKRMSLLGEGARLREIEYKGYKVLVPISQIPPPSYNRNHLGDYLRWRQLRRTE